MSLNLGPSLRHQKQMHPHHGLETVAKPPLVTKCSAQPLLELPAVGAACVRILPSTAEGGAVTPPDHEGAVGKQWARVSSVESRRCSPVPTDPEGKDCFYLDLLVCCRAVSKSALISRESRQQGSGPALPRPAQSQRRAELPSSPCPVYPRSQSPPRP